MHPVKLVMREDDTEDIIRKRLELYKEETLPILDFYKNHTNTKVIDFEAKKGKGDYPTVESLLSNALKDHAGYVADPLQELSEADIN